MFFVVRRRRVHRRRAQVGRRKYLQMREAARRFVHARISALNAPYGFRWKRIAIRNTRSRWGSCSRAGNLNFNYKILLLPPELADYIIVHELCHLAELNHSPAFWALVSRTFPDYAAMRRDLKKSEIKIRLIHSNGLKMLYYKGRKLLTT